MRIVWVWILSTSKQSDLLRLWAVLRFKSSLAHCTGSTRPKGIFIATSDFSKDADEYVSKIGSKIVLIDGSRLAELMIESGVAVATDATYTVKLIDNDFFESI
jgi:restriction endonuclease Mrr